MAHKSVALAADKLQLLWQQWAVLPLCLLLCFMYAADTIMVAASLHWYKNNPTSAQLLLLAEVMKLVIALTLATVVDGCCSQESSRTTKPNGSAAAAAERLPLMAEGTAKPGPLSGLQQVLQRPGVASQVLHFSVPAVCYFVSNNLSFYALRLLPAYTYMLLTSLKILTTALLSYTFLGKEIPTHQQVSYVLMLLAVNLGTAKSSSVSHSPYLSYNIPAGLFIMLAVAACSALATVYTEWVMNYSCYRQESINLQNARLYVAGVVLNGGFYVYQTVVKQVSGSSSTGGAWSDIRLLHWGIIISLAFMGLLVSVIIKWHGSGVKVMASATAMFASAWASQVFLGEAAPWLFWLGAVAAAAALLLHSASPAALPWAAASSKAAAADGPTNKVHSRKRGPQLLWLALIATVGFAAVVAYKAPVSLAASPSPSAASASSQAAAAAAAAALDAANNVNIVGPSDKDVAAAVAAATAAASAAVAAHVDSLVSRQKQLAEFFQVAPVRNHSSLVGFPRDTNLRVPAMYLPIDYASTQQVCAPLSCSLSHQCTVNDPRCCMFYLIKMLEFFTKFVESYGLEREWFAVYGIALGAIRHPGGFTPWTNDVDIGASPRLINFLESTAVRDEMWQYGEFRSIHCSCTNTNSQQWCVNISVVWGSLPTPWTACLHTLLCILLHFQDAGLCEPNTRNNGIHAAMCVLSTTIHIMKCMLGG
jgi:probable UDP-sugar transporter A4